MYQHGPPGTSVFEVIRDEIPLERVIQANGHRKVQCIIPTHEDPDPSMVVYDDHVHCFGCGFHGDVVDVWSAQKGLIRPIEAALDLAREFNIRLPEMSEEARKKSEEKREKESGYSDLARACHHALDKHDAVREWWEGRGFTDELREKFLLGSNKTGTEAVIPFWHRGRIQGLIRRKLQGEPKYILPSAEELPGGRKPLFIPGPLGREIFVVEGYIDAMAVAATGRSAVAVGGTQTSNKQIEQLRRLVPDDARLYILADSDAAGEEAARTWGRELFPQAKICEASYDQGGKDIADVFACDGAENTGEHLDRLLAGAQDMIDIETKALADMEGGAREKLAYATEHIVPLLARIQGDALRDATTDIVVDQVKQLKKSWLNKAIKAELERLEAEGMAALMKAAEERARRQMEEYRARVAEAQPEIDTLFEPGVLGRLGDIAARMHNVYGDREPLELALLVALGAQLEPLPNGRPLGASILLTAEAGRGKNHVVDAAVKPLPPEFYFAFEIASGQSLYYAADEDPDFLKHTFAYPNEIEGAEQLWEFLRPMLSKGWAKKIVTAKDADGNMVSRTIVVEGPVTIAIPTIRNKTDEQLQTRLLLAELPDYPGRVKHHSATVSEQLLPDAAATDYSREKWLWQEGLRQRTAVRRVVFPLKHPDFALDDDKVSHGARLWANLLGLMSANAWLEQKNRRLIELPTGAVVIEATPDDYETAYRIFTKVCKRTVINLSDTHRKILNSLYDLHQQLPHREGFTQREIAKEGKEVAAEDRVSQGSISNNKTFLIMSAKLMKETEHGLALVEGAEPSWWATGDLMTGLPTPDQVQAWWENPDPPSKGVNHANHLITDSETGQNPYSYAENGDYPSANQELITISPDSDQGQQGDRDYQAINEELISENGSSKGNTADGEGRDHVISSISGSEGEQETERSSESSKRGLTPEQVEEYKRLVAEGMHPDWARAEVRGEEPEDLV